MSQGRATPDNRSGSSAMIVRMMRPTIPGRIVLAVVMVLTGCQSASRHTAVPTTTEPAAPTTSASVPHETATQAGFISAPVGGGHLVTLWAWDGQTLRTIHTDQVADCCTTVSLSPDGSRLLLLGGQGAEVLDDRGRLLGHLANFPGVWADDSRHFCVMVNLSADSTGESGLGQLEVEDLAGRFRKIAQVGAYNPHGGPGVARCSVDDHQAVVLTTFTVDVTDAAVVSLDDGQITKPRWTTGEPIMVSADGRYITDYVQGGHGWVVADATTGQTVAPLPGQPRGISWEGHVVITTVGEFQWRPTTGRQAE